MKELKCKCGNVVARLEKGSLIKKGTIFTCLSCASSDDLYEKLQNRAGRQKKDNFNAFNKILKNKGYDLDGMF